MTAATPATDAAHPSPELSFEALVSELDTLVKDLEGGHLSLQDSLAAFERGMTLSRKASAILDAEVPVLRPLDEPL
jgi:exodeoxyribonuclease VII small subunit